MTSEEAITTLELAISEIEWNYPLDISIALETAIEALRKQIPRKPKQDIYGYYQCPFCMADDYALMHDSNIADRYNYCHNCGQALDFNSNGSDYE